MAMSIRNDILYIGLGSHVAAIQASTGQEIWRTKLKWGASYTTVSVRPEGLFAGASGHLFCLDPATGAIRWHNKLEGLGSGLIAFSDAEFPVIAAASAAAAAAAGSGA
jgi:outer membrane protein assembly factor BamB